MERKLALISVIMICLVGFLSLAFKVEKVHASGTIYIRADGSIDPPTAHISTVDTTTYTFTDNILNDFIVVERDNIVIDGIGYMLQGAGSGTGIALSSYNVTIRNVEILMFNNGIGIDGSSNTIRENNITYNDNGGVFLGDSASGNLIQANYIARCEYGIWFWSSSGNTILENDIHDNNRGIYLYAYSHLNIVSGNTLRNNDYGVHLRRHAVYTDQRPEDNRIFHNNLIDNADQVYSDSVLTENFWDDDYLSGGNYWSDYTMLYPDAEESDDSGIWDTPYIIDTHNQDNYPLVEIIPESLFFEVLPLLMIAMSVATLTFKGKHTIET